MGVYPKKVMTFEYKPGKTLVMGIAELKDEMGALAEATSIVAKMGVDLTQSSTYAMSEGHKAIWNFIGVTAPDFDTEKLEKALCASPRVMKCETRKSDKGLLTNTLEFPVWTAENQRGVLFSPDTFTTMFAQMKKLFGTGGAVLIYEQGQAAGKESAGRLIRAIGKERLLSADPDVVGIYASFGWGQVEVLENPSDGSRIVISIKDNFEAVGLKTSAPNCQFIRGILAGSYSVLNERATSCEEVECIAMGAPACKFVIS